MAGREYPLVAALMEEAGRDLRSVVRYDEDSSDVLYLREDVDGIYSTAELDALIDDLRLQGGGRDRFERVFNAGALACPIRGVEDALLVPFVTGDVTGVFSTSDRGSTADADAFISVCRTHL